MLPASTSADPEDEAQRARDWWGAREMEVERDLATSLQRRVEAQRAQLYAFKMEQSKWEHELQLRISKYAHDRKLLSEHNVELQEKLLAMDDKLAQHQREMDLQVHRVIELEGSLQEHQLDVQQMRALRDKNDELQQRLRYWERFCREEKLVATQQQKTQQDELLAELERLLAVSEDELVQRQHAAANDRDTGTTRTEQTRKARTRRRDEDEDDPFVTRIKELEAACRQKDQAIISLKQVVEQQETAFDEKLKIVTAKYDQVKTINMALQKRLMHALTEGTGKSSITLYQ